MCNYLNMINVKSHNKFMDKTLDQLSLHEYDNKKIYDKENYIMVFLCDNNKLHIEGTDCVQHTLDYYINNVNNIGSWNTWLTTNKPKKLLYTINVHDLYSEDEYVIFFMYFFGINRVRGGSFMNDDLDVEDRKNIIILLSDYGNVTKSCTDIDKRSQIIHNIARLYTYYCSNVNNNPKIGEPINRSYGKSKDILCNESKDVLRNKSKDDVNNIIITDYFSD